MQNAYPQKVFNPKSQNAHWVTSFHQKKNSILPKTEIVRRMDGTIPSNPDDNRCSYIADSAVPKNPYRKNMHNDRV